MISNRIKKWSLKVRIGLNPNDKTDYFILASAVALLAYTVIYSLMSDITADEAFTYTNYSTKENPLFFSFHFANNHPLNSFFIYFTSFLFPYKEFFIRLPNILFLVLYLIYAIKISKSKIFSQTKIIVFTFLAFYHYLIPTFFSQARGYGIATTLVLIFIYRFNQGGKDYKKIITNFYILLLATSAFTGLIPLVIAVVIYYVLFELKFKLLKFIQFAFFDILLLLIGYSWLLFNLIEVSGSGKPLFGSETSFLPSTIGYYLNSFSDFFPKAENELSLIIFCSIFLIIFIFFFIKKSKDTKTSFLFVLTFLLLYLGSKFSGRPFITGRLLLPFFPLVVLSFFELIVLSTKKLRIKKKYFLLAQGVLTCLIFINFSYKTYKINPKTARGNYQDKIFNDLNLKVKHDGCCSSIPFYLKKIEIYPPIAKIKSDTSFTEVNLTEEIKGYYSFGKGVLLLEALNDTVIKDRFLVHINLTDNQDLPADRKQYGFDNKDFLWNKENNKHQLVFLGNYDIKSLKVGQFNEKGVKWKRLIKNSKIYPSINKIKSDTSFTMINLTEEIKAYYSFEKSVLLLEALNDTVIKDRFLVHINLTDNQDLPADRKQYGFDNKDFFWNKENNKHQLVLLGNYDIKSLKVGQFNEKGVKWKRIIKKNNE